MSSMSRFDADVRAVPILFRDGPGGKSYRSSVWTDEHNIYVCAKRESLAFCATALNNGILYEQVLHGNNLWESSGELIAL